VRSIVIASSVVCAAAGARAAIRAGSGSDTEVSHAAHVSMKGRELAATFMTTHDDGDPPIAHALPKREPRRATGHAVRRAH